MRPPCCKTRCFAAPQIQCFGAKGARVEGTAHFLLMCPPVSDSVSASNNVGFFALRLALAPLLETLIVLDRAAFLCEEVN